MRYAWIKKHKRLFSTALMCRVLKVSTSGYYDSIKRNPCPQLIRRSSIAQAAAYSYFESDRVYGCRKVYEDLIAEDIQCCDETVRRIMRRIGLYSRIKRKFVVTTDSDHIFKIADNLLNRNFTAKAPNQKWAADITYIPTKQGWLYLAVVMDLFSRRIVGWSSPRIPEISKSDQYHNVIAHLKRMHNLPRIHLCNTTLYPTQQIIKWFTEKCICGK